MSKFIKVQTSSSVEYGSGKRETVYEWQWINLDYVTNYFQPAQRLCFSDESQMTITEEGEKVLLRAFESQGADLNNKQPIKEEA